jgi:hypothetical protein
MATTISRQPNRLAKKLEIIWETLPPDFVLPEGKLIQNRFRIATYADYTEKSF